ncbi:MAG TPA: prepilin-type N-terminal cleavage/methylation domain-containing protein [Gemmataceae bacterium]|nr:prepilin-type N-terminal cleavage/methylation domain-containing protein [Gemmataceae bacterium]
MRRRSGFTLVEVLVAMALILFIMTILAAAFGAATQTVSDLKSAGDMAERLRGAATVIRRDLEATHCYNAQGSAAPIRSVFGTSSASLNPPPKWGFVRIEEGSPAILEGTDVNGLPSYYQTTAALAYTMVLQGKERNDFMSAFVPGSPLTNPADATLGPPDQRFEDTPNTTAPQVYNSPCAEAALFLVPTNDSTDSVNGTALPLYGLYRRQMLCVPPTALWAQADWNPGVSAAQAPGYIEISALPNAGEGVAGNLTFNSLMDLTQPVRRFWMTRNNLGNNAAGLYQPLPGLATPGTRYPTMGECNAAYQAADLLMPDVLSMDVRVLVANDPNNPNDQTNNDFRDLFDPAVQAYASGANPAFLQGNGPRVFDTWSGAVPATALGPNYSFFWNQPGHPTSIPLYQNGNGTPIQIQAIQITLRVWDFKTKKSRQVTIVQQM